MTDPRPAPPPEPALAAYRRFLGGARESWVTGWSWIVLALLVLAPVVPTLDPGVPRPAPLRGRRRLHPRRTTSGSSPTPASARSSSTPLLFAARTTLLTLLIAVPMAVVVVRTKLPGGRFLAAWHAVAVLHLLADPRVRLDHDVRPGRLRERPGPPDLRRGPVEPVLDPRHGAHRGGGLAPIAYVFCANALRQSDSSLESAAQVCGPAPSASCGRSSSRCCGRRWSTARSWSSACRWRR